jgi:HlyD family secretion protein
MGALAVLAAAVAGVWFYWVRPRDKQPEYRTAVVARGDLVQSVTASGQLNPVVSVQVGSQISGMIQRLYVDFNSSVTQGQVIAELDPATYRAAVHQSEGELANARAALELAQVNARRAEQLSKDKLISQSDYDKAIADLHQAEAEVMIRQAALEKARVDLSRCTISAPTNGMVISRNVDVGQTVAASLSAPTLFVIANDLGKMQIDAMISEADIGAVEIGQSVNFTVDAFPLRMFNGRVIQIRNAPTTNQNVVTYDTVVEVENPELKLKPGMTANVSVIIAQHEGVLKIPNAALRFKPLEPAEQKVNAAPQRAEAAYGSGPALQASGEGRPPRVTGEGWSGPGGTSGRPGGPRGAGRPRPERSNMRTVYTLVTGDGSSDNASPKPQPQPVKIGISDGAFTEITEGLREGDTVVVGVNVTQPQTAPANPFGGGPRRF